MRIAVFGLGYVGVVTAACLADAGHNVIGVDSSEAKVEAIARSESPVKEPRVPEMISAAVRDGRLQATSDVKEAIKHADAAIICVGTPSRRNGSLDTQFLEAVTADLGDALAGRDNARPLALIYRSTMLPGTVRRLLEPLLIQRGLVADRDYAVGFCPEFLRETTAVADFQAPPFSVIGTESRIVEQAAKAMFVSTALDVDVVDVEVAEALKYACNAFHAVKVTFANEIGRFCSAGGIDAAAVMDLFVQDDVLNISPRYLRPGFGFGGSCLPKDVRAMRHYALEHDVHLPLVNSLLPSNDGQIAQLAEYVIGSGARRVAVLGVAFKYGTDDLRESPYVTLVESLISKGIRVAIFDQHVAVGSLVGKNRSYVEEHLPHVSALMRPSIEEAVADAELIVVGSHPIDLVTGVDRDRLLDAGASPLSWPQPAN